MPFFILSVLCILLIAYGIYTKAFSSYKCQKTEDTICLKGQLRRGYSTALLPVNLGVCKYIITVQKGKIRINHLSYNQDGGTWSLPPQKNQKAHYDIEAGNTRKIELVIGESFKKQDKLDIVNISMCGEAEFQYTYLENDVD